MCNDSFLNQEFKRAKNITRTGKQRCELIKLFHFNVENATEAMRAHRIIISYDGTHFTQKTICDLVRKNKETECTCDRPYIGRYMTKISCVKQLQRRTSYRTNDNTRKKRGRQ